MGECEGDICWRYLVFEREGRTVLKVGELFGA